MGSVPKLYVQKSGGFWFNAYAGGKRGRYTVPGPGKREALKQQLDLIRTLQEGRQPSVLTTGEWLEHWLAQKRFKTYGTKRVYTLEARHIQKGIGSIPLAQLAPRHIRELYAGLDLAPATLKLIHAILKQALQMAEDDEEIAKSPMRKIQNPGGASPEAECFTREEGRRLIEVSRSSSIHIAILLGLYAGLRVGEVCALRWDDIQNGTLHVHQTVKEAESGQELGDPKSKSGIRSFRISETLVTALLRHKGEQAQTRLTMGNAYRDEGFVLAKIDGSGYRPSSVSHGFTDLVKRHGLRTLPFHALRHSHLTWCMENREDLKTVSRRAGHSDVTITSRIYGHPTAEMDEGLARRFDAAL